MFLCFGSLAWIIRYASRFKNNRDLVHTIVSSIDPQNRYGDQSSESPASRLMNCKKNFPNEEVSEVYGPVKETNGTLTNVTKLAGSMSVTEVAKNIQPVLNQMDEDKKIAAIAALQNIIKNDPSLCDNHKIQFEKCMGAPAKIIANNKNVSVNKFFGGLFLYTVLIQENESTEGEKTVAYIKDKSFFKQFLGADINIIEDNIDETDISDNNIDSDTISVYLHSVLHKFSKIKTLLYSGEPRPFYDFYVCNTLNKRFLSSVPDSLSNSEIQDATPEKIAKYGNYIIIEAYGGMGKSMMMRHLLLSAVNEYKNTQKIPLMVYLKDYDGGNSYKDLFDHIFESSLALMSSINPNAYEKMLKSGNFLILLDGLDELSSTFQNNYETALNKFIDMYPNNQYIMSSRPFSDFVSYSRFTILHLLPFTNDQALTLINKLEFRPDEPSVKEKFIAALQDHLFETHQDFTSNPLLLTIMLMTFNQIAEISPRMRIFYRDAYAVLSQKHDASKGAYKRSLKTGMNSDEFSDFFAEFCARSYIKEKYLMTESEAKNFYNELNARKKHPEIKATATDFLYDLCSNICLLYLESGTYHFTHRSFQEYFCALYFSNQKDKDLEKIGKFFEKPKRHYFFSQTFPMLFDMIPEKVEEYIFLPHLNSLLSECEKNKGYWTYLERMYPKLTYDNDNESTSIFPQEPKSYLTWFISDMNKFSWENPYEKHIPCYGSLLAYKLVCINDDLIDINEIEQQYIDEHGEPEIDVFVYDVDVKLIQENPEEYKELLSVLDAEDFPPKIEYIALQKYRDQLHDLYNNDEADDLDFL